MRSAFAFGALLGALSTMSCGLTEPSATEARDGGREAAREAALPSADAGADAHPDARIDAGPVPRDAGVDACKPKVPAEHRPTASTCSTTRPPGYNAVPGVDSGVAGAQCTSDSQCTDAGANGRCTVLDDFFAFCSYDQCAVDSDCGPSSLCICGASLAAGQGRDPNQCVPATCHVDSDCGQGGYCSPSPEPCTLKGPGPNFAGVAGYYCHTAAELCTADPCANAADCDAGALCEWDAAAPGWFCAYGDCA